MATAAGTPMFASIVLKAPSIFPDGVCIRLDVSLSINADRLTPYFELPEESTYVYLEAIFCLLLLSMDYDVPPQNAPRPSIWPKAY